ncbi:MAG: AAA family ATPase [Deltaproteobacteria bacterium]|jgi:predicted ATPase|nr:AAA family ATPase [Deltaproteobacteria bacterium]
MQKIARAPLERITIEGFKSFRNLKNFVFNPGLNILIGPNGAGKSNFIDFFRVMEQLSLRGLADYVGRYGRAETFFFQGTKTTRVINIEMVILGMTYSFSLLPTVEGRVEVKGESLSGTRDDGSRIEGPRIGPNTNRPAESNLGSPTRVGGVVDSKIPERMILDVIAGWRAYHFRDTSPFSPLRKEASIFNSGELFADGSNLPAVLWGLKANRPQAYENIVLSMRQIMPVFDDFVLEPEQRDATQDRFVRLCWRERGSRYVYQPWQMSDGALCSLALVTVLRQPDPPPTIIIDEPELGLHPSTLDFMVGLMHWASEKTQLIVATQSPDLLRTMEPENVIVVHQRNGETTFERLEREPLSDWLKEYSLTELWLKNVIRTDPDHV